MLPSFSAQFVLRGLLAALVATATIAAWDPRMLGFAKEFALGIVGAGLAIESLRNSRLATHRRLVFTVGVALVVMAFA